MADFSSITSLNFTLKVSMNIPSVYKSDAMSLVINKSVFTEVPVLSPESVLTISTIKPDLTITLEPSEDKNIDLGYTYMETGASYDTSEEKHIDMNYNNDIVEDVWNDKYVLSSYGSLLNMFVSEDIRNTVLNDSNIPLYRQRNPMLDSSKNLFADRHDTNIAANTYDSSMMWGSFFFDDDSGGDTEWVSTIEAIEPKQYYVLIFDRGELGNTATYTPRISLSYLVKTGNSTYTGKVVDMGVMSTAYDRHVYRFKMPSDLYGSTVSIMISSADIPSGNYTFNNLALFKATDYENMLMDSPEIYCKINYDARLESGNVGEVKDALANIVDVFKTAVYNYIEEYDSMNTTNYITVEIQNTNGTTAFNTATINNYLRVRYNVKSTLASTDIISDFTENEIYLDDYHSSIGPLGKFTIELPSELKNTSLLEMLINYGYSGSVSSSTATADGGGTTYTVSLVLIEDLIIASKTQTAVKAKTKTPNYVDPNGATYDNNITVVSDASVYTSVMKSTLSSEYWVGSVSDRDVAGEVTIDYTEDMSSKWDTSKNTYESNQYEYQKITPSRVDNYNQGTTYGEITDSFTSYKNFFYENLDHTYIDDVYHKHEWFRLYGTNKEENIHNVFMIKRNSKESIIILNGIPLEFTNFRLVEYNNEEYIVVDKESDITSFGELHTSIHGYTTSAMKLYIHKDGTINFNATDGMFVAGYTEFLVLGKGYNYIPDGKVSIGNNYLVVDKNSKLISYKTTINYFNKTFFIPDDVIVYAPVKNAVSMYEEYTKVLNSMDHEISEYEISDLLQDHLSTDKEILTNTYNSPNLNRLTDVKSTKNMSADIDLFLEKATSDTRRFFYKEEELTVLLSKINTHLDNLYMPKLLIPCKNPKGYNVLVYKNRKLFKVNPVMLDDDYIEFDIPEVYDMKDSDFDHRFDVCVDWYNSNKVNNEYEIAFYNTDDIVLEGTFTKFNDNYIPLPLNVLGKSYEVYIDGVYVPETCITKGNVSVETVNMYESTILMDTSNTAINVPILTLRKTSTTKYSIGSKFVLIATDREVTNTIVTSKRMFVYNENGNRFHTEYFYTNGEKVPASEIIYVAPHCVILPGFYNEKILIKSDKAPYTNYQTKFSDEIYAFGNFEYHNVTRYLLDTYPSSTRHEVKDILYTLSLEEFNTYTGLVSTSYLLMKNGVSATSKGEFESIRLGIGLTLYIKNTNTTNTVDLSKLKATKFTTAYYDILRKISPYVFKETTTTTTIKDTHFYNKISYLISIMYGEFFNSYTGNKYLRSVYEYFATASSTMKAMDIILPEEYITNYNNIFGTNADADYLSYNNQDNLYDYVKHPMTVFYTFNRVGVPYGIVPKECFLEIFNVASHSVSLSNYTNMYNDNFNANTILKDTGDSFIYR